MFRNAYIIILHILKIEKLDDFLKFTQQDGLGLGFKEGEQWVELKRLQTGGAGTSNRHFPFSGL